jgi:hypothetical protein
MITFISHTYNAESPPFHLSKYTGIQAVIIEKNQFCAQVEVTHNCLVLNQLSERVTKLELQLPIKKENGSIILKLLCLLNILLIFSVVKINWARKTLTG